MTTRATTTTPALPSTPTLATRLHELVSACFTGIWVQTHEPHEAARELTSLCRAESWRLGIWNCDSGIQFPIEQIAIPGVTETQDPLAVIRAFGTILMDGINTFTGTTSIEQGIAALSGSGAIANSSLVTISAGATLDVQGIAGGYLVGAGQTIGGSGTVLGSVVFGRGSTISPGMTSAVAGASLLSGQSHGAGLGLDSQQVAVPEPSTLGLVSIGLSVAGLLVARRKRAV